MMLLKAQTLHFSKITMAPYDVDIPTPPKSSHILLVEDYEANIMVAQFYIEECGYTCDVATCGLDAQQKAKTGSYAAILMDVRMPHKDGFEVTRIIRAYEQTEGKIRTPIIGITAHALLGDRERCLEAGMDDYISKPMLLETLRKKLKQHIKSA